MAGRIRPTSTSMAYSRIDPDSEDASAAAMYVTQPEKTGFRTTSGLRPSGSNRSTREGGDYDLSSAGTAANYASRNSYMRQAQDRKRDSSMSEQAASYHDEPLRAASKAAHRSLRDSGISGLSDEPIKEDGPEARAAATGAMTYGRKRVEFAANEQDDVAGLTGALSAANISHRVSQRGKPTVERKADSREGPRRAYNPAITNYQREMYTSHPPVSSMAEERRNRDNLQSAAVLMAQQMYAIMPKEDDTKDLETSSFTFEEDLDEPPPHRPVSQYEGSGTRAWTTEPRDNTRPHSHYFAATKVPRSSSIAESNESGGYQRRSSWLESRFGSQRRKPQKSYDDATLAAAQRNVHRMMSDMEHHIYTYSTRPSPAMIREWERTANERVMTDRESKADTISLEQIRGGRFVPPRNVEDMARARVRPTLRDIDRRIAARKSRRVTEKLDDERYQRIWNTQKLRDKEVERLNRRIIGITRYPRSHRRVWGEDDQEKRRASSEELYERNESNWPRSPKITEEETPRDETTYQAPAEGREGVPDIQGPSTPTAEDREPSGSVIPQNNIIDRATPTVEEGVAAEAASKEETAVTEQAGSQARHVRRHKAVHKSWITKPPDPSAAPGEPPREVERIEERIITEIEKERPATPNRISALAIPGSPHPSSHWSSSNESRLDSGHESPGIQRQDDSGRTKKRLGLPHLFQRSSRRNTSGGQGSFTVNRRSVPEGTYDITPGQPAATDSTAAAPMSRLSKFQENL